MEQSYDGHPCLTAEWFLLWLEHFSTPDTRVRFVKITRRGNAVAYFPFLLHTETLHGVDVRALRLAGNIYSPITTPIVRAGSRLDLFDFVARDVLPALPHTVLLADDMPLEYTGPAELHVALTAAGGESCLLPSEGNWIYERQGVTSESYLRELDSAQRNSIKRWQKRFDGMGRVELRVAGDDVTDADIRAYQAVYARSWKEPELDPTFHPALMRWAAARGVLRLFLLSLDGRPVATQLWLLENRRAYAVKFAYDEAFKEHSPGSLLMWRALEHLFDVDHVELFDFLKGDDTYKKQWASRRRQRLSMQAFAPDLRGRAVRWAFRELLPWVRRQPVLHAAKQRAAAWLARDRDPTRSFPPPAARTTLRAHDDDRCGSEG